MKLLRCSGGYGQKMTVIAGAVNTYISVTAVLAMHLFLRRKSVLMICMPVLAKKHMRQ